MNLTLLHRVGDDSLLLVELLLTKLRYRLAPLHVGHGSDKNETVGQISAPVSYTHLTLPTKIGV